MKNYHNRTKEYYRLAVIASEAKENGFLTEQEAREAIIDAALATGVLRDVASGRQSAPLLLDSWRILCRSVLLPVCKMTGQQYREYSQLKTAFARINWWNAYGFTRTEAKSMERGSTAAESFLRQGGVWQANQTTFPQARSASHARKLFVLNFGNEPRDVRLVTNL